MGSCLLAVFMAKNGNSKGILRSTNHPNPGMNRFEVVSKPQIRFKGKAQADRESAAYIGM
jgi:hypothetical protein